MYRLLLAVLVLTPVAVLPRTGRQAFSQLTKKDLLALAVSGIFLGLHFLFWIASLKMTSVASSMIITTLQPTIVGIVAYFVFHDRFSFKQTVSLALAFLGTLVIALGDESQQVQPQTVTAGLTHALSGDMLSLLGTICISGYMLVGQHARARLSSTAYNWTVFLVAGLSLLAYSGITGVHLSGYRHVDWLWLVLLALVPTLFGHAVFNWLLRYVNATTVSVTILGEPVGAILLSAWLLHERLFLYQLLGGLITLAGVWIYMHRAQPQ